MITDHELQDRPDDLRSDYAKLAGRMSAINGYLDNVGVPKIKPTHRRVKLLTILYQKAILDKSELSVLLADESDVSQQVVGR